ncbi:hypothetical protein AS034_21150 [[Bacillus] enclensis]|uniref:Uncharacterized protein n=1 Tax=[Bacillus] enclensis TaxID=1402860 RepID=A0A0V8H523_9BACI|nr:hypothetical protein [[Bacillus] enclensis]KSU57620.1 hypothetical protein AS034_21150 [[Bacillus] enclensis]SCC37090.1 hypothetical protein GA0061094_4381 [[Bacillus] enclensis]
MNAVEAKKRVNLMGILASISLGIQLLIVIVTIGVGQSIIPGLNIWSFIDLAIGLILVIWLFAKKSRTAAIGLLFMYLLAQVLMLFSLENTTAGFWTGRLIMMALFIAVYFRGVHAAFVYHRLKNKKDIDSTTESIFL